MKLIYVFLILFLTNSAYAIDSTLVAPVTYTYKKTADLELQLDVFFPPEHAPGVDRKPVILLFHGGGWVQGKRDQFNWQCDYFARRGIVAITASYRFLKSKAEGIYGTKEICIRDAKSAVRWVKLNAEKLGIDTGRVILGGGSAGGHLATMAALDQDINDPEDDTSISTKAFALVLFNPAYNEKAESLQPFPFISLEAAPAIMFFGDKDQWKQGGDRFYRDLRRQGVKAEIWVAPGQSHGFFNDSGWNLTTCSRAESFLAGLGIPFNTELIPGP